MPRPKKNPLKGAKHGKGGRNPADPDAPPRNPRAWRVDDTEKGLIDELLEAYRGRDRE